MLVVHFGVGRGSREAGCAPGAEAIGEDRGRRTAERVVSGTAERRGRPSGVPWCPRSRRWAVAGPAGTGSAHGTAQSAPARLVTNSAVVRQCDGNGSYIP